MLDWLKCGCTWKAFVLSTCTVGVITQLAGAALLSFTVGAAIYSARYWWAVKKIAEREIERALKK